MPIGLAKEESNQPTLKAARSFFFLVLSPSLKGAKHFSLFRGLIMGIWNSHTSIGNVLGNTIAGAFVEVICSSAEKMINIALRTFKTKPDQLGLVLHGAGNRHRRRRPRHVLPSRPLSRGCWLST